MNQLVPSSAPAVLPALFAPTPKAVKRFVEFFAAQLNNDHTRKAYLKATRRFAQWCGARGIGELAAVEPFHVAAFIKELQDRPFPPRDKPFSPPTVKQHLSALRMLFDWLVTGHIMDTNPAHPGSGVGQRINLRCDVLPVSRYPCVAVNHAAIMHVYSAQKSPN
jgi:Phage integrase, N-terminal SAM-like domain